MTVMTYDPAAASLAGNAKKPRRTRKYPLGGDTWEDSMGPAVITDAGPIYERQTKRLVRFKREVGSTGIYTLAAFLRRFKLVKRHPGHRPSPRRRSTS